MNERDGVQAAVIASTAGLAWSSQPTSGLVIKIGNFDGTNRTFSWSPAVVASTDRLGALSSCLDNLQMRVRFPDPANLTQPHFIESAAIHCIESSGMPAYVIAREADASEYDVALSAGDLPKSTAPPQAVQLYAWGSSSLGAHLHIRTNTVQPSTVLNDVRDCRERAVSEGVFITTGVSNTPDSSGWQTSDRHTTIQPMVDRFVQCLRGRGYDVGAGKS